MTRIALDFLTLLMGKGNKMSSAKRSIEEDLESSCEECGLDFDHCECVEYVNIELPTRLFIDLSLEAHELKLTFNDHIINILKKFICNLGESNDCKKQH